MTAYRENLVDRVIRVYGYEHFMTVRFAQMCEILDNTAENDQALAGLVQDYEKAPQRWAF